MNQATDSAKDKIVFVFHEDINVLSEKNLFLQDNDPILREYTNFRHIHREHPYILREDSNVSSQDSYLMPEESNTPYDDVFRTLATDCPRLLIPLVNELFHENYNGTETVSLSSNIHFILTEDGGKRKRENDSHFSVTADNLVKRYHIECQSTDDGSILVRMFEYGALIAIHSSQLTNDRLVIPFPDSALIALRHTSRTPDTMELVICTSEGEITCHVPVLKIGQYTWKELFEKRLYFLIPFHIFTYEKILKKLEEDEELPQWLKNRYIQIIAELIRLNECGEITEYTKQTIMAMSQKVLRTMVKNNYKAIKGVSKIMGGHILEYEAKTIKREGIREGLQIGRQEGRAALGSEALKLIRAGKLEEATKLLENPNQNLDIL